MSTWRIGIDLGGTKIEIAALDDSGAVRLRERIATPSGYNDALATMAEMVRGIEGKIGVQASVGIGIPGAISPAMGVVKNANSNPLNGHALHTDMSLLLGREIRVENDANCFALSEAVDGAGAGYGTVFGVILGTGCGGGLVVEGKLLTGRQHLTGEWGHMPLPWQTAEEYPGKKCWCGARGCLEIFVSGPGLAADCDGGGARDASGIPTRAAAGEARAIAALQRHADRLGRGLAVLVTLLDPDVIVLGGGLSNMAHLYTQVPEIMRRHVFSDVCHTPIVRAKHGDSSGVRGAAWLWPPK
ncbi:MAG: ROK family protein [Acetobacteraceae bacterium]|nr:ROK family protein [Acetobacteraceae bacterium]MSP30934.1 ROK family protein [Acetobacteraceae bacterium]